CRVQPFDERVIWLSTLVVRVVAVAQRELAARRRMRADSPAAWLMAVVLLEQLVHAGADRADDAELGKVRPESRPKPIVRARLIDGARVHLKPLPQLPRVYNPEGYAHCSSEYQAWCDN